MKKFLAVIISVLFLLSFTVAAYAAHETEAPNEAVVAKGATKITLGGKILIRGWYFDDVSNVNGLGVVPSDSDSHTFYTTNVNLLVDAQVSDNLRGFIEVETARNGSGNSGLFTWGDNGRGYDSKPNADILIRNAWIQYTGSGLLGIPAGIKIGHMPITLGEKVFLNNERFGDDAILVWIDPTKELHVAAGTVKLNEGDVLEHSDDLDGYVVLATYQWDKDNIAGANVLWAHSDGNCPALGATNNVDDLNFYNIGLHAGGKIGGLIYAAEVDKQIGKIEGLPGVSDVHAKGYGIFAKIGYALDAVNLRASFAYGSGDNDGNDEECEEFQTLQGPDYAASARLVHYTQIYERTVRTAANSAVLTTTPGGNTTNTGIANTTFYNIGVDVNAMPDMTVSLDGFLLRASKTGAWEDDLGGTDVDKNVGWEVDAKMAYKIARNLTYFVEAGMFKPGDFYHDIGADTNGVTQAMHGLLFAF